MSKYNLRSKYNFGTSRNITALHRFYSELTEHYPFYAAHHYVKLSVLLTHYTAKISPIRVNGTLFGHFSIIRQSNSYL